MRLVRMTGLAMGLLFCCSMADASEEDQVKEIVNKVETRYRKMTDLTADFNQSTTVKGFATALQSSGRIYLKRPGKLRDTNGSVSNFLFSKIRANTGLKDAVFGFSVPQDVEVVPAPTLSGP